MPLQIVEVEKETSDNKTCDFLMGREFEPCGKPSEYIVKQRGKPLHACRRHAEYVILYHKAEINLDEI